MAVQKGCRVHYDKCFTRFSYYMSEVTAKYQKGVKFKKLSGRISELNNRFQSVN